jgi:acetyl esterase/lipase
VVIAELSAGAAIAVAIFLTTRKDNPYRMPQVAGVAVFAGVCAALNGYRVCPGASAPLHGYTTSLRIVAQTTALETKRPLRASSEWSGRRFAFLWSAACHPIWK